ncbi:MAG: hypothetical protein HOC79_08825 [Euryarchaeota archaeon]|jgi:predicted transcriptional regulator|nr:hypothetical protein [Euryarchaeota archaeon]
MSGRVTRASCPFCQDAERDNLEGLMSDGIVIAKTLDKDKSWREGTSDRHFRNHMGEYHLASNSDCLFCTSVKRESLELAYYNASMTTEEIAKDVDMSESSVYNHLKYHLKPVVQKGAAGLIAIEAGNEMNSIRDNLSRINGELTHFLDDADRNDPQYVKNIVSLHKEVRDTVNMMIKIQDRATGGVAENLNAQTINILKVELAKESPEVWKKIRNKLLGDIND